MEWERVMDFLAVEIFAIAILNAVDYMTTIYGVCVLHFYETNPLMQPLLSEYWPAMLVKVGLSIALLCIGYRAFIAKRESVLSKIEKWYVRVAVMANVAVLSFGVAFYLFVVTHNIYLLSIYP